ncbi:MAG TPA: FtsW/RodA/SpoVE family cell cycle protein [Candidatus Limnocylindrales bacterium]|nr:FtsW/RodA/SpoVE family cell cycle protein [Candidatus Limnocylindrales bacterium]
MRAVPGIHPRWRRRELSLLLAAAGGLFLGWVSLASTQAGRLTAGDPTLLIVYLALLFGVHGAFVLAGRRTDQVLLPTVGVLGGLSLLLMARLPQGLASQSFGSLELGLAPLQLLWLGLAVVLLGGLGIAVRNDYWLRYYKYSWAAAGIGLLLLVFFLGEEVNGQRLSLRLGPISGQPSELLKVILVVFLAGYLADNRALIAGSSTRLGPLRLPPLPYLLPMLAMWGLALSIVVVQKDLGAALLFFSVFLAVLYIATSRASLVVLGVLLFLVGAAALYQLFPHVRDRVDIWLDPFAQAQDRGFQIVRALYAFGRGGVLGTGLGAGLPQVGGSLAIPAIHTDFVFAALAEELGMAGALAILALYLVLAQRGLRIAVLAADDFRSLLAAGLTTVIVIQAAIIMAGNLKLVPLTGITLPFISYGGSSLLANAIIVGFLIALSDQGVEPLEAPRPGRRERLAAGARSVSDRIERVVS